MDPVRCVEHPNSVLVTGIKEINGYSEDKLELYFGKRRNGGGDINTIIRVDEDTAVIMFDNPDVASSLMRSSRCHVIGNVKVHLQTKEARTTKMEKRFATQWHQTSQKAYTSNSDAYSTWQQHRGTGNASSNEDVEDVFSSDDSGTMDCEDESSETKGNSRPTTSDSSQPISIQCKEDALNYIQAVHFEDLNRIQRQHKVTVDQTNQNTVIIKSAGSGNIHKAADKLRNLVEKVLTETEQEVVALTSEEAQSKNYSAAEKELTNSVQLLVKVIGKKFYFHGTRPDIDAAKRKLRQMLGSSSGTTSSQSTTSSSGNSNHSTTATKHDSKTKYETRTVQVSNQRSEEAHTSTSGYSGRQQNLCDVYSNGKVEDVFSSDEECSKPKGTNRSTIDVQFKDKVEDVFSSDDSEKMDYEEEKCPKPKGVNRKTISDSSRPISVQGKEDALNYIQVFHHEELDRMQRQNKVNFDRTSQTTVTVKSVGSDNTHEAVEELKNLIKKVTSETKEEVVTLTLEEAESKNYFVAEKELTESMRLLVKVVGRKFYFYGTRPDIDAAKSKLKQMLGPSSGKTSTSVSSTASKRTGIHNNPSLTKHDSKSKDTQDSTHSFNSNTHFQHSSTTHTVKGSENLLNYVQKVHSSDLDHIQRKNKVTINQKGTAVIIKSNVSDNTKGLQEATKEFRNLTDTIELNTEEEMFTLTPEEADSKQYIPAEKELTQSKSVLVKVIGNKFYIYGKSKDINSAKTKFREMLGSPGSSRYLTATTSQAVQKVKPNSSDTRTNPLPRNGSVHQPSSRKPTGITNGHQFDSAVIPKRSFPSANSKRGNGQRGGCDFSDSMCSGSRKIFEITVKNVKVIGTKSNILDEFASVIVCSSDNGLQCNQGIAGQISELCGPKFKSQCARWIMNHGNVRDGEIVWVDVDEGIACSHVVNAVVPRWNEYGTEQLLEGMLFKIFKAGRDNLSANSIVLPLLGTASYGIPRSVFAKSFVNALSRFLVKPTKHVREIRIVDWDERGISLIEERLPQLNTNIPTSDPTLLSRSSMDTGYFSSAFLEEDFQDNLSSVGIHSNAWPTDQFASDHDQKCPICWGPLRNKKSPVYCSHACCGSCFRQLESNNQNCGVCRKPLK
ncbi:uncharacterized protein [Antedon mediterranea]